MAPRHGHLGFSLHGELVNVDSSAMGACRDSPQQSPSQTLYTVPQQPILSWCCSVFCSFQVSCRNSFPLIVLSPFLLSTLHRQRLSDLPHTSTRGHRPNPMCLHLLTPATSTRQRGLCQFVYLAVSPVPGHVIKPWCGLKPYVL